MDENNTNGFGNTDDEYEDEGTTVLTTPGVSAFANPLYIFCCSGCPDG